MQPKQSWPKPVFVLRGPDASGKSHLASIWAAHHGAPVLPAATLSPEAAPQDYFGGGRILAVEDIETVASEPLLLHLFNFAQQQEFSLLLTVNDAACWERFTLPDLRSRLQAAPQAHISQPDDMLLAALLIKHLQDRQLTWSDALIAYLLPRLERSFDVARNMVQRLDESALRRKQPLTVALARQILAEINGED